MNCTTVDCERPATLYLCPQCITDLDAWIVKAHEYAPELDVTIARQDVLRRAGSTGGGGNKSGSTPAANLDAVQIQANLYSVDRTAEVYAHDQFAAGIAHTIQEWCQKAERLISGPEPERVDHAHVAEQMQKVMPMTVPLMVPWLADAMKVKLTAARIHKWAQRGKIKRANQSGDPTYHPADVLRAHHESRAKI